MTITERYKAETLFDAYQQQFAFCVSENIMFGRDLCLYRLTESSSMKYLTWF